MHYYFVCFVFILCLAAFPFRAFSQGDSISPVKAWLLLHNGHQEEIEIDTSLSHDFQSYPWYYSSRLGWNGNTWSPVYPLYFIPRYTNETETAEWLALYPAFRNSTYYHTKKPFSLLNFNTNANKPTPEQNLEFLHTQNIIPWWNVGLSGNFATSKGKYEHQENRMSNLRLFSSFSHPNHTGYISYNFGKAGIQENGGISDLAFYRDSLLPPENIPVSLTQAVNTIKYRALFIKQEHVLLRAKADSAKGCFPWTLSAGAGFTMNRYRRMYTDNDSVFYASHFIDSKATADSLQVSNYKTEAWLKLDLCRSAGFFAGGFFERHDYGVYENHFRHDSPGILAGAYYSRGRFDADAEYHYHYEKNEKGLSHIHGECSYAVSEKFMTLFADFSLKQNHPLPYDEYYFSNHFFWSHHLEDISDLNVGAGIAFPFINGKVTFRSHSIDNAVIYDTTARPVQMDETLNYQVVSGSFCLQSKHWKWAPHISYQQLSSPQVCGIPSFITMQHISYRHRIFKVLDIQAGTEVFFASSFYGPAYMPATMVYYAQHQQKTGGYPVADVFVAAKLKRARFIFKVHHVNDRLMERNHFLVAGYPLPDRHYTLGISWSFYN
jgi:hypothetical protein